jgi:hypothetical protein
MVIRYYKNLIDLNFLNAFILANHFLKDAHSAPAAEFRSGYFGKFLPKAKPSNFPKNRLLKKDLPK